jgi:hypothetical protein
MSKLTKAESARINGAKSKGPKTEEGKARSRFNALRHGLAANTVCLTKQERPIFEAMVEAYNERFRPADTVEEDFIEQMCVAKWRQRRCWSMETAALNVQVRRDRRIVDQEFVELDDMTRNTLAFMSLTEKNDFLQVLGRYEANARRAYHRAVKDLRELQAGRKAELPNEPTEPDQDDEIDPELEPETAKTPQTAQVLRDGKRHAADARKPRRFEALV